ncbi:unnamed protein product [Rotaria magnacalcarata]|uniref:G-protein coupled receptors family 1 profile domain-containing protein n=1 Tax=Rotaria magnacalcarata TaxID=392030 RepID=A0A816ZQM7_9BILA|nr:unnamed protein product [Rotaria magnacalcarata]CAF2205793.1 unnamed protein product [Rotaria magnacalcarata]CAF4029348.1 unnamed protein product [Rotaria magnacalcarata]CAF4118564.1 unnamed protein product [Rotaria magnacalcarata]
MNVTYDSSRDLRRTRLILLSTLFFIGLTGCSLVLIWLIRYTRWNARSARVCSLILNLIIANLSVYIFATGVQIYWELQTNRQWPFNDLLCRIVKFFQSFSILSSTYIVVAMAIDRCIAIVTPLKVGKIRVLYLCGSAWTLAGLLSTPNFFIFHLQVNDTIRYCTAIFNQQSSRTGRRVYLTFISLVVYFIPFLVLVFSYTLIFINLLFHEHDQRDSFLRRSSPASTSSAFFSCWSKLCNNKGSAVGFLKPKNHQRTRNSLSNHLYIEQKVVDRYAKARSKTFRMIIVLVLFMITFGAPYYCLELYVAYAGRQPSDTILALAGGAAVAPSSIDPWIFLLFWVNWSKPTEANNLRKLINLNLQRQNWTQSRRNNRFNTFRTSSPASNPNQHHILVSNSARPLPSTVNNLRKLEL